MTTAPSPHESNTRPDGREHRLSILVGAPDGDTRESIVHTLRSQGHDVLEAADAHEVRSRLSEHRDRTSSPVDVVLCAGLFAENVDATLAAELSSQAVARAVILLPQGGVLATAARAHKVGAAAVVPNIPDLGAIRQWLDSSRD